MRDVGDELVFAQKAEVVEEENRLWHVLVAQVDAEVQEYRETVSEFLPNVYRGDRLVRRKERHEVDVDTCRIGDGIPDSQAPASRGRLFFTLLPNFGFTRYNGIYVPI